MFTLAEILASAGAAEEDGGLSLPVQLPIGHEEVLKKSHPVWEAKHEQWRELELCLSNDVNLEKERFIPRGTAENAGDYANRLQFARFAGETAPLINRLVGALFRIPPTRENLPPRWRDFVDNVDGCGTTLNRFMEDRAHTLLAFGAAPFIVDRPAFDPQTRLVEETTSKGFEQVTELRQVEDDELILVPYKLSQVTNWDHDAQGELHWLRVREEVTRSSPDGNQYDVTCYREWDRQSWRTFEVREVKTEDGPKRQLFLVGFGDHFLGVVPLVMPWIERDGHMNFSSPFMASYNYDIAHFRNDADLQYDTWLHAHPTLKNFSTQSEEKRVNVGPGSQKNLDPTYQENFDYAKFPTEATEQLRLNKEEAITAQRRVSGIDVLSHSNDPNALAASGVSRSLSFSVSEERLLTKSAQGLQSCEKRLFEIAERWISPETNMGTRERASKFEPIYPRRFDPDDANSLIDQWQSTRGKINSETYDRALQQKIVEAVLGDVPQEVRDEILDEIKKNPILDGMQDPLMGAEDAPDGVDSEDVDEANELADLEEGDLE